MASIYERAFATGPANILVRNGVIEAINPKAVRQLGYEESDIETLQGKPITSVFPNLELKDSKIKTEVAKREGRSFSLVSVREIDTDLFRIKVSNPQRRTSLADTHRELSLFQHYIGASVQGVESAAESLSGSCSRSDSTASTPRSPELASVIAAVYGLRQNYSALLLHDKIKDDQFESHSSLKRFSDIVSYARTYWETHAMESVDFCLECDPSLLDRECKLDHDNLRMIIEKLLANAVKHTKHGEIKVQIGLEGDQLHFKIQDTGSGMDQQVLNAMLEGKTLTDEEPSRNFGGAGLHLSVFKEIVERFMQGTFSGTSATDKGSCFEMIFPASVIESSKVTEPASCSSSSAPSAKRSRALPVLVVDDTRMQRQLLTRQLTGLGFEVEEADDGDVGLEMMKKKSYSVVFMDIQMPKMNGIQATEEFRAYERDQGAREKTPIIAHTANEADKQRFMEAGMDGYIIKGSGLKAHLEEVVKEYFD